MRHARLLAAVLLAGCSSDQGLTPESPAPDDPPIVNPPPDDDPPVVNPPPDDPPVINPPPPNASPSATAGADRGVDENTTVILQGVGADSDGSVANFAWTQTAGAPVTLTGADTARAQFSAPSVAGSVPLTFRFTVRDDRGASASDEITLTVADTTVVSVREAQALEGDSGAAPMTFVVALSAAQPVAVTLSYATAAGSASETLDFTRASGSLSFAPGETVKTVAVQITGDTMDEPDEAFSLALADIIGVGSGQLSAAGLISDAACAADLTGAAQFSHLIGSLHEHSGFSDGTVGTTPADYFAAGQSLGLDFMGSAEHSDNAAAPVTANEDCASPELPECATPVTKWQDTLRLTRAASGGAFTAFRGFEWTSDRFGHINVFFSANDLNAKGDGGYAASMEPFWTWMKTAPDAGGGADGLAVFNHPGREDTLHAQFPDAAYTYNDFEYRAENSRRVIGIEMFGKGDHAYDTDNNAPTAGWYAHALDKGWHLGPVGAEDEHGREWAKPTRAKTVLLARDRSEAALREALAARRFYALAQHHNDLRLSFTADGAPMGARLARVAGDKITLSAALTAGVHDGVLEIVTRGGEVVASSSTRALTHEATVVAAERWYYLRVKNAAGRPVAYSAPVWIREGAYPVCPRLPGAASGGPQRQSVVAHRGASGHAPEHTIAAYDLALAMGSNYIEQDIAMTADGVLVCLHDDSLDRTARGDPANCSGQVATKTLAQLKTCDMGAWFDPRFAGEKIPTLEEVFQRYGKDVNYYIETKTLGSPRPMEQELLRLINQYGLREGAVARRQVLVQSFTPESLQRMRALDADIPLIQLFFGGSSGFLRGAAEYAFGVGPPSGDVTRALVDEAHALGMAVHPYTVNSNADLTRIGKLCVDGLFTNFPDRYRALVDGGAFDHCAGSIR